MSVRSASDGSIQRSTSKTFPSKKEEFRIERELSIDQRRLRGVRLFGTLDDPEQDLSPRIIELFKQSPGAYLGLLFRQFEGGLNKAFSHD